VRALRHLQAMPPRQLFLVLGAAALVYFAVYFHEGKWQPTVDLAWAAAVLCWTLHWWRSERSSLARLPQPYWLYALYAAALLPFCTNWRWSMTADSLGWAWGGMVLGFYGPQRSLLSLLGVGQFGYTQLVLHNIFAWFIAPTLFWHRVGQVGVGVLSLAAIYTVYGRLVTPAFGLLVAACALTTSIMIVHTLCSYPLLDAVAAGHAVVAIGMWVERDPQLRKPWLSLGLCTGLLLYLTPNSWAMGIFVWGWLLALAIVRRWSISLVALGLSTAFLVGLPIVLQVVMGQAAELLTQVEKPAWTLAKVMHLSRQAVELPFAAQWQSAGAFGPQLPVGFRWLFVVGALMTPVVGRYFPGARFVAAMYLFNLVLMVFTQGRYMDVSVKRGLVLIPMATYFAFLPFHRVLRSLKVVLPVLAVWASFGIYDVVARISPGRIGATINDGIVEIHQRVPDSPICVVMGRASTPQWGPGGNLDLMYDIWPHVQLSFDTLDPVCAEVLCHESYDLISLTGLGYVEIEMLSTLDLRCGLSAVSRDPAARISWRD